MSDLASTLALHTSTTATSTIPTTITCLLNLLIQIYTFFTSTQIFCFLLPTVVRFRTVFDYRLTHEYLHRVDPKGVEKHTYFQGLVIVTLNAYLSTILLCIIYSAPLSVFHFATPFVLTWGVFTSVWLLPIRFVHSLSKWTRFIPALFGIVFECLLCIWAVERAIATSFQWRTNVNTNPTLSSIINNPTILSTLPTIAIPSALFCGYLMLQGNAVVGEMFSFHANLTVKATPTGLKRPFFGPNKIGMVLITLFVFIIAIFVPVDVQTTAFPATNNAVTLLPSIVIHSQGDQITDKHLGKGDKLRNGNVLGVDLCVYEQSDLKSVCYDEAYLTTLCNGVDNDGFDYEELSNDDEGGYSNYNEYFQLLKSAPSQQLFTPFDAMNQFMRESKCMMFLAAIQLTQTTPCENSDVIDIAKSTTELKQRLTTSHQKFPHISATIEQQLHSRLYKLTQRLSAFKPIQPHIDPTTPIAQSGQPLVARMVRNKWIKPIVRFAQRVIMGVMRPVVLNLSPMFEKFQSNVAANMPSLSYLYPRSHTKQCINLRDQTGKWHIEKDYKTQREKTTNNNNNDNNNNNAGKNNDNGDNNNDIHGYSTTLQSTLPIDALFLLYFPISTISVTIIPITYGLLKSFLLLIWFLSYFGYLFINTKFQTKFVKELDVMFAAKKINNGNNDGKVESALQPTQTAPGTSTATTNQPTTHSATLTNTKPNDNKKEEQQQQEPTKRKSSQKK